MPDSEINSRIQSLIQSGRKIKNIGHWRDSKENIYECIPIKQAVLESSVSDSGVRSPEVRNIHIPMQAMIKQKRQKMYASRPASSVKKQSDADASSSVPSTKAIN